MTKVANNKENLDKCICPRCPTYVGSNCPKENGEKLYCSIGKSKCDLNKKGCICGACPLWSQYSLSDGYFCLNGEAL